VEHRPQANKKEVPHVLDQHGFFSIKENIFLIFFSFLFLINLLFFLIIHFYPIFYQQGEMIWQNIFWSMDMEPVHSYTYHTGLRKMDFIKIFLSSQIDFLGFRMRHLSYLIDMLGFKFWQFLGIASFHNYTQSVLHALNAILLWILVFRLTKNSLTACLSSLLLLNSGIAISTLLFPFRSAKLLVVTLFLTAWIFIENKERTFSKMSVLKKTTVFTLFLLCLFTDETAVLLLPLIFIFIMLRDGVKAVFNKEILIYSSVMIGVCVFLVKSFLHLSRMFHDPAPIGHLLEQLAQLRIYFLNVSDLLRDSCQAFFLYFLRRNLGYWDLSSFGILAIVSSVMLLYFMFRSRPSVLHRRLVISIGLIILLKAFILANPSGVHPYIMPANTKFPSLLFFNFYYTYSECVFIALVIGLLLNEILKRNKGIFLILLTSVTCIAYSNVIHASEGVRDLIKFHESRWIHPQTGANILSIDHYLRRSQNKGPVYLSFPSGNRLTFVRWLLSELSGIRSSYPQEVALNFDLTFRDYASIIPVMYLRSLEEGKAIISLQNVHRPEKDDPPHELLKCRFFLDVPRHLWCDLEVIKKRFGSTVLIPQTLRHFQQEMTPLEEYHSVFFFIKGAASLRLSANTEQILSHQTYGQSYQLFEYTFDPGWNLAKIRLDVESVLSGKEFELVGPFWLDPHEFIP